MPSKQIKNGRTFTVAEPPIGAALPPFTGAFGTALNSNSMPQPGSDVRAPLAVRTSTPPRLRRKEGVVMPSPIQPRAGLLDTPAATASSLSSAPTRLFRDVKKQRAVKVMAVCGRWSADVLLPPHPHK
jgi:hypothetical protein